MTEEDNYLEELTKLLDGIELGRLQIIKMNKKTKTKNTEIYNITVLDTAIPDNRKLSTKKPTKNIISTKKETQEQQITSQKQNSGPVPPKRPIMCRIEKIE